MDTAGYNLQFKNMQIRHNIFKEYQIKFICYMFANYLLNLLIRLVYNILLVFQACYLRK